MNHGQSISSRRAFLVALIAIVLVCIALGVAAEVGRGTSSTGGPYEFWQQRFVNPDEYKRQSCEYAKNNDNPMVQRSAKEECSADTQRRG